MDLGRAAVGVTLGAIVIVTLASGPLVDAIDLTREGMTPSEADAQGTSRDHRRRTVGNQPRLRPE